MGSSFIQKKKKEKNPKKKKKELSLLIFKILSYVKMILNDSESLDLFAL